MVYLLYTNSPKNKAHCKNWKYSGLKLTGVVKSNITIDNRLWWSFDDEEKATKAKEILKNANQGQGMILYLSNVDKIPHGWD